MRRELLAVLTALMLILTIGGSTAARAATASGANCAYLLQSSGTLTDSGEIVADPVPLGCYQTYAQALYVGSEGSEQVSASTTPGSISEATLDASTQLGPS